MQWNNAEIVKPPSLKNVILFFDDGDGIGATVGYWEGDVQMWVGINCDVAGSNVVFWTDLPYQP